MVLPLMNIREALSLTPPTEIFEKKTCSNRQYLYVSAVIKASTVLHLHMRLVFRRQIAIKLELAGEQFKQHL